MTEKRFQYIRGKYSHGVHDTVKDGEYKKGYRTTYDEFDLDKLTDELNIRENKIKQLEKENEQLKKDLKRCREWINTDKYDYETTLAFIKSKGYSLKDVLKYKGDDVND